MHLIKLILPPHSNQFPHLGHRFLSSLLWQKPFGGNNNDPVRRDFVHLPSLSLVSSIQMVHIVHTRHSPASAMVQMQPYLLDQFHTQLNTQHTYSNIVNISMMVVNQQFIQASVDIIFFMNEKAHAFLLRKHKQQQRAPLFIHAPQLLYYTYLWRCVALALIPLFAWRIDRKSFSHFTPPSSNISH